MACKESHKINKHKPLCLEERHLNSSVAPGSIPGVDPNHRRQCFHSLSCKDCIDQKLSALQAITKYPIIYADLIIFNFDTLAEQACCGCAGLCRQAFGRTRCF